MPLVHRLLVTLRTLMEDEPEPQRSRPRRKPNNGNRNRQTTALILTFRDLFRSGGLNIIVEDMEVNRRPCKRSCYNSSCVSNTKSNAVPETALCLTNQPSDISDSRVLILKDQNTTVVTSTKLIHQDETLPLLQEDSFSVLCTDLVPRPSPIFPSGLFGSLALYRRKNKKPKDLTVPLNPNDENKTVETLKKVLKWSPRKQNSATFAVSLPIEERHTALAVVENAVNRVKEEQLRKKKRRFLWLKLC